MGIIRFSLYLCLALVGLVTDLNAQQAVPGSADSESMSVTSEPSDESRLQTMVAPDAATSNSSENLQSTPGAIPRVSQQPVPSGSSSSSNSSYSSYQSDDEAAREALRRGKILPYGRLLKRAKQVVPGNVVKVWLLRRNTNSWSYEFVILKKTGEMMRVSLNAGNGDVIKIKRR